MPDTDIRDLLILLPKGFSSKPFFLACVEGEVLVELEFLHRGTGIQEAIVWMLHFTVSQIAQR